MSKIGRTCNVPTEACAYQVPLVPWRLKTSVKASVYSAKCTNGTAQSSIKLTGLPSPFKLIMMLSPALRTSHRFFCGVSSIISTTLWGKPRSPINSTSWRIWGLRDSLSAPANSTNKIASGSPVNAVRIVGANAGFCKDRSIMVRSTSSTAVSVPLPNLTMCCAASIAW